MAQTVRAAQPFTPYGRDTRHSAFPGLCRCGDGRLQLVYREGSNHYTNRDGALFGATSTDGGRTWSAPAPLLPAEPGVDFRDPSVTELPDGSLALTYFRATATMPGAGAFVRYRTAAGWGPEYRIDPNLPGAAITAPVVAVGGRLLAAHYSHQAGEAQDSVWLATSTDGTGWRNVRLVDGPAAGRSYQEPWITDCAGTLVLTFRWGGADVGITTSTDGGVSWSPARRAFTGNGRAASVYLDTGTLVVAYRDARGNSALRASTDLGATWWPPRIIDLPPAGGMSTYTASVPVSGGRALMASAEENVDATVSRLSFTQLAEGPTVGPFGFVPDDTTAALTGWDTTVLATTFSQPDGPLPAPWSTLGQLVVTDGLLRSATADNVADYAVLNTGGLDQSVTADLLWSGQSGFGLLARWSDAGRWLLFTPESGGSTLRLYKRVDGTTTQLAATTAVRSWPESWATWSLRVSGRQLVAGLNGQVVLTYTLTDAEAGQFTGTQVGLKLNPQSGAVHQCRRFVATR